MRNPKAPRRTRTATELQGELEKQVGFLKSSAAAFDAGNRTEAVRLATAIRVLLHEKGSSKALLEQLGRRNADFLDTAFGTPDISNSPAFCGLAAMDTQSREYSARLDEMPSRLLPFKEWWGAPVLTDHHGNFLTRESLVTIAANQDGGAHVDPDLDDRYAAFTRDNAIGWTQHQNGGVHPLGDPVPASIRQVAHEVLKSLDPAYSCSPEKKQGIIFQGFITLNVTPRKTKPPRYDENGWQLPETLDADEPCFCGSGREYGKCHGVRRP